MKKRACFCTFLRVLPFVVFVLASCGEQLPIKNIQSSETNNHSATQRAISTESANPLTPLAVWSSPQDIWSQTFYNNFTNHIYGPILSISQSGNRFIALHKGIAIDSFSTFIEQESVVLYNAPDSPWSANTPFAAGTADTNRTDIVFAGEDAYALWRTGDNISVNHLIAGTGWQKETPIGPAEEYSLLVDSKKNAYIVWIDNGNVNIAQYSITKGLQPTESYSILNKLNFADPIITSNDEIVIGWMAFPDFSDPFSATNQLKLNRYVSGTGWGTEVVAPTMNSYNSFSNTLKLAPLANDQTLVVSQLMTGIIYANVFDKKNATWGNWQNVDYNIDRNDYIKGIPKLVANNSGDAMLLWVERTFDNLGNSVFRLYTNSYNPVANAAGSHWPQPLRVATVIPPSDANALMNFDIEIHPRLAMNNSGQAVALWTEEIEPTKSLHANYYTKSGGWSDAPDTIISYETAAEGAAIGPDVKITDSGAVTVVWRQRLIQEFSEEIHVWVTDSQFQ